MIRALAHALTCALGAIEREPEEWPQRPAVTPSRDRRLPPTRRPVVRSWETPVAYALTTTTGPRTVVERPGQEERMTTMREHLEALREIVHGPDDGQRIPLALDRLIDLHAELGMGAFKIGASYVRDHLPGAPRAWDALRETPRLEGFEGHTLGILRRDLQAVGLHRASWSRRLLEHCGWDLERADPILSPWRPNPGGETYALANPVRWVLECVKTGGRHADGHLGVGVHRDGHSAIRVTRGNSWLLWRPGAEVLEESETRIDVRWLANLDRAVGRLLSRDLSDPRNEVDRSVLAAQIKRASSLFFIATEIRDGDTVTFEFPPMDAASTGLRPGVDPRRIDP